MALFLAFKLLILFVLNFLRVLYCPFPEATPTCAKLCRKNGGDLEQIKFLLGHVAKPPLELV